MSDTDTMQDALELSALLRPFWPEFDTGPVVCEGDDGDDGDDSDDTSDDDAGDVKGPDGDKDAAEEAAKWKALARKHQARAKANADKAKKYDELEESNKSEVEKATGRAEAAEKQAAKAERRALQIEVALDKAPEGMPVSQIRKLAKRLTGESQEDLEADAEELFADFQPDTGEENEEESGDTSARRPTERLKPRSGSVPNSEPEETNPDKLAASVPRMYD